MKFSLFFDEDKTIERKKLMQSFYDAPAFLYPNDGAVEIVSSGRAAANRFARKHMLSPYSARRTKSIPALSHYSKGVWGLAVPE